MEGELPPWTSASLTSLAETGMSTLAVGCLLIRTENVFVVTPVSLTVSNDPGGGERTKVGMSLSRFEMGTVWAVFQFEDVNVRFTVSTTFWVPLESTPSATFPLVTGAVKETRAPPSDADRSEP